MSNYTFEICANSVESCVIAQEAGADRVELCSSMPEGGTTPSYGEIKLAREILKTTKLHVIIRPRGGDFLYNDIEKRIMIEDIRMCRNLGVDGVVIGCLLSDGNIDVELTKQLVQEAGNMSVTFHRAFDMCIDPFVALEKIIRCGCDRVLTSGQENTAYAGAELLSSLNEKAKGRIIILAGSGVNEENISEIANKTGIREFHFSGKTSVDSQMKYRNSKVSMGGVVKIDEYKKSISSFDKIKSTMSAL